MRKGLRRSSYADYGTNKAVTGEGIMRKGLRPFPTKAFECVVGTQYIASDL